METSGITGDGGKTPRGTASDLQSCADRDTPAGGPCFVVGIGASEGGQEPLEHIFATLPSDCNLAFVVVMHLPADGPSLLTELLRRYTAMDVLSAENGSRLLPNTVYVIPPGTGLTVANGKLRIERSGERVPGAGHPIDRFFTALAADCGERAIAVVLSGFGTDGAEGVKRIREKGGVVLVQVPETALNPSMPGNAVATGAANMVLTMEEIPLTIAEIAKGHCNLPQRSCLASTVDEELDAIFALVKARTGHDFSSYKRNTVMRRLERRMTVNESGGLRKYLSFLEQNLKEAETLAREILVGVTSFFRDPEAFEALRTDVIPMLFENRDPEDPVRIWHACCATGEEAYSVAMLVREHLKTARLNTRVQIFATDIDEAAVARARSGLYPEDIGHDVEEERLVTFFTRSLGRWQVGKELREMILFACHNVLRDPPFSRLDLLVCRNFLIYLNPDMQKRIISLFHLVLKPGGILFLGTSEAVGRDSELFAPLNKKYKIYRRLESDRRDDSRFPFKVQIRRPAGGSIPRLPADAEGPAPGPAADRLLLERYAPPGVVVNDRYEVLHISTRTGGYLEVPVGTPSMDILKMAREELRPALRAAIYKSLAENKQVVFDGVRLEDGGDDPSVNVVVEPLAVHPTFGRLALVILEPVRSPAAVQPPPPGEAVPEDVFSRERLIRQLEEQLRIAQEQLRFTTEQLEASNEGFMASNEELMSINEEFQAANEELQSTNEELEASREELQALNQELVTTNAELQGKVEELDRANSDLKNLFASSGIATLFLDRTLTVKGFSPAMAGILNLIPSDIGLPFRQPTGVIDPPDLLQDARDVLESLTPVEREVASPKDGRRFIMRVLPYQTMEGNIDGIVVILVDITELRRAEEGVRSAALFPLENPSPVLRVGGDGTILFINRSAEPLLSLWRTDSGQDIPGPLLRCIEDALADGVSRELDITADDRTISFAVTPFPDRNYANLYGRDITKRKRAEEAAHRARAEWERTFDSVPDLIAIMDREHRIVRVNRAMAARLGMTPDECSGMPCYRSIHGTTKPPLFCPHVQTLADGREHVAEIREEHLGGYFLVSTTPLCDDQGRMVGAVHVARDITRRKKSEEALRESEARLARAQEIAHLGSWELDLVNNRLTWSDEVYRIFGLQPGEFDASYEAFLEATHPDDRAAVDAAYSESLRDGRGSYETEHRIVRRGTGEVRVVHEKCEHFRNDAGRIIRSVGMVHDITERKIAEEALMKARAELEAKVEKRTAEIREKNQLLLQQSRQAAMGEMIGNIAHQWRQPLNTLALLIGTLPMLLERGELSLEEMVSMEEKAMGIIQHMSQTINDFSNYFKPDKEKVPFNAGKAVAKALNLISDSFANRGIAIEVDAETDPVINGYPNEFSQVLLNILLNARDAITERRVSSPRVVIRMTDEQDRAVVTVADNAGGIPEEIIDKIFDPYFTTKSPENGTGVGLFMSKGIIEKSMGGRLTARNTGAGAEFRIEV